MITGSKQLIRDINSKLVLETILEHESISRAAIAKELGLTKATISAIVADLITDHLVVEIGSDDTSLGRKPILLSLNKKAGHVLCIDLGVNTISILLTDLYAQERHLKQVRTPSSPSEIFETLASLIATTKETIEPCPYGLVGITLGIHGVTHDNQIAFAPYYDIAGLKLAENLEQMFGIPVFLENEANLSVLGEHTFAYDAKNIANINIHSGIGLGLILEDKLYTGYNGYAGEFGHTIVEPNGVSCPCGNHGCLEQYLSERALLSSFAQVTNKPSADFMSFAHAYKAGESHALTIMEQFVTYMTIAINNVLTCYNPEIIVINSRFTSHFPELIPQITKNLNSRMHSYESIVASSLGDSSILLGGISVGLQHFLGISKLNLRPPLHS